MFARKGKGRRGSGEPFTYVHEGTVVHGDLEAAGRVRIHGTVLGNVTVTGLLEVASEGTIRGDRVEAEQVRILGTVEAIVTAVGKVEIWRGGRLEGDVRAASLDIEEGASFTGRSEMRPPGAPPALTDGRERPKAAERSAGNGAEGAEAQVDAESPGRSGGSESEPGAEAPAERG
jgi:cytoskeletal protein CcmA (bactofilin family)